MFRIVCDPSPGSTELCLTEITRGGSQIFFVCLVGVWQRNFEPAVCVHGTTGIWSPVKCCYLIRAALYGECIYLSLKKMFSNS